MPKNAIIIAAAAAVCFISEPVYSRVDVVCSLQECLETALKNNEQLRAADGEIFQSQWKEKEAHPHSIPVVKYEYRLAPVPTDINNPLESFFGGDISVLNAFKIELAAPLSTFGKLKTGQALAQMGVEASWFKKQKTADDIVLKIHQIYYGILLARELLSLARQAVEALEDKVKDMQSARVIDQLGVLKIKVALYEVQRKIQEAVKKERMALEALKVQMGLPEEAEVDIKDRALRVVAFRLGEVDAYIRTMPGHLPEYALLETGLKAKQKQLSLEKRQLLPNLGFGGFFDIGRAPRIRGGEDESAFSNPFNFTKIGMGFQLKGEYDFIKSRSKIKQAEADLLKTTHERQAAIRGLKLDVRKSYYDVVEASRLMEAATDEKRAARQMVFLTKSNLDIGLGEKKDYLDALQSYLLFQGREYEAIFNYNVAVSELKKKTGTLYKRNMTRKEIP